MQDIFRFGDHVAVDGVADRASTLGEVFLERVRATPDAPANFEKIDGVWSMSTWSEFSEQAHRVAGSLADLGVECGDRVAILGPTSTDWARFEIGTQLLGAVTVGLYPHQAPQQVRHILEHSGCRVVLVADGESMATVVEAADGVETLAAIVPWVGTVEDRLAARDDRCVAWPGLGGPALGVDDVDRRLRDVRPEDTAMLIYTSGTTGPPKGVMISHGNVLTLLRNHAGAFPFYRDDLFLAFLPMAHATERNLSFYMRVGVGVAAAYASSMGALLAELGEVGPTVFGAVPRIFEKAYDRVQAEVATKPAPVRALFDWAVSVGRRRALLLAEGRTISRGLTFRYRIAEHLVFRKIRDVFGGRIRAFITGAAPTAREVLEFFWAAGMPVYEAYGMTESTVLTHSNRPGAVRLGTVGRAIPTVECKIAGDGEVLLRGPLVFQGYHRDEAATAETIVDGWLQSGDVGTMDDDGYLTITDRKKHLIITAGGKNVAPANIERAIKNRSPLISHVHAHGDRRPYISALIAPSPIETLEWGAARGRIDPGELERLRGEVLENPSARSENLNAAMSKVVADPDFTGMFLEPVRRGNRDLTRVETVRRFVVLDRDFSQEHGELTPTMKLRRKAIEQAYADTLDRLYDEDGFGVDAEPPSPSPGART